MGLPFDELQLPVDYIPTSVIKSCVDVSAPLIAFLAKLSSSKGKFPTPYKTASITPLLKKRETDPDVASNYRPISNLHTISKMLEICSCHVYDHMLKLQQTLIVSSLRRDVHIQQKQHC